MRFDPVVHKLYKIKHSNESESLIEYLKKEVVKIVENKLPTGTVCASFRSLGAEDMVIIFLSDSIKDIISAVDTARTIEFKYNNKNTDLFSTVYMFTGLNKPDCDDEIGVKLVVNLHMKNHNINNIKTELEKLNLNSIKYKIIFRGKGTIQLEIPADVKVGLLFGDKKGLLNESSEFHKKNLFNSRVYFEEEDIHHDFETIDKGLGWKIYGEENIGKKMNNVNPNNVKGVTDVANFVFGEYKRLIANERFCQWHDILNEHCDKTYYFVQEYMKYDKLCECSLLENMQASLHLINQACSPTSDIPYHNYYYSGSFSDLLKAYYGIIRMLFNIIYNLPHSEGTVQHKIVFAIRLEAIARIQSVMYTLRKNSDRIIVFSLPYDSFWNYTNNIKLLIHEAFHYAAPYDRVNRNMDVLNIIFKLLLIDYTIKVSDNFIKDSTGYSDISQETREWNAYLLNLYKADKEVREKIYRAILDKKYNDFFELPASEWRVVFCKNKNLDLITLLTSDAVKKFIKDNACKSVEQIKKSFNKCKLENWIKESKFVVPDNDAMRNKIISTIDTINYATKEAFCDIWAIKITKVSVYEYIVWLFKVMIDIKSINDIGAALNYKFLSANIRMASMPLRLYLLLYYNHKENGSGDFNPGSDFNDCFKDLKRNDPEMYRDLDEYIQSIALFFKENIAIYAIHLEDMYNMAFGNLSDYFGDSHFTENDDIKTLGEVYNEDLTKYICEKALNRFVYYTTECPKLDDNSVKQDVSKYMLSCDMNYNAINLESNYENNVPYIIKDLSGYISCLNDIYKLCRISSKEHSLWFRGICDMKYSLLPSLFRYCNDKVSLYANQANIMKKAYFHSTASIELWNQPMQQKMASLQHYGVPTNLLDFSLDMFVAIYFAVNPDNMKDRADLDAGLKTPVVYVFNPIAYSNAIEQLKAGNPNKVQSYDLSPVVFDFNQSPKEYEKFFLGDMSYEYLVEHTNVWNETYIPCTRKDFYPVPMVVEHTNPRIVAQSGVFVAYPLNAKPANGSGEERYRYIDLLTIQDNYNKLINSHLLNGPFLYSIQIQKSAVPLIRKELKQFNIVSGKYYPELFRHFDDMKD